MTPAQIRLLQQSFQVMEPVNAEIGSCFYDKLFELAPETRALFMSDVEMQWRKLMDIFEKLQSLELPSMLILPVTSSGSREVSIPGVADLAESYAERGARPEHFAAAKTALFWSLERHLGSCFDSETSDAWGQAFDIIAESMVSVMMSEATGPTLPNNRGRSMQDGGAGSIDTLFRD